MFERVVVGVDGSGAGFGALRQATRLLAPHGRLLALTVVSPHIAVHAGFEAPHAAGQLWEEARAAHDEAASLLVGLPGTESRITQGRPVSALLAAAATENADLVAVGTHGGSRAAGITFGSIATAMLHDAPCPVLIARPAAGDPDGFPRTLVAGYDGSVHAQQAVRLAERIAENFDASLRIVVATGGKPLTLDHFTIQPSLEVDERHPVKALVAASHEADLLVIGSRGLHGLSSLGSVSERVAHRAACSVLVVRPLAPHVTENSPVGAMSTG